MANRLREFRERAGLTQGQLAEAVGCGLQHISRMERGERDLSKKWAMKIAPVLETSWATLMADPVANGFAEEATTFLNETRPPLEYSRLPEQVQALTDALKDLGITLPPRALTRHAQEALAEATKMNRRLSFEERARIAAEAKAADINRTIG